MVNPERTTLTGLIALSQNMTDQERNKKDGKKSTLMC